MTAVLRDLNLSSTLAQVSSIVLQKRVDSSEQDRIVSVRPPKNMRVLAVSYVAAGSPCSLVL